MYETGKENTLILLVEDDLIIATLHRKYLVDAGFEVIHFYSCETAIEFLKAESIYINLILMDIDLGEGNMLGTEGAEIIVRDFDIPLIFLSSHTEKELVQKTENITSYGYIVKNTGYTVMIASIKMALKLFSSNKNLYQSEEKLRYAEEVASLGHWSLDLTRNELTWSSEMYSIFEISKKDNLTQAFTERIHADDLERVNSFLRKLSKEKRIIFQEYKIIKKDGSIHTLFEVAKVLRTNHNGKVLEIFGVVQDITDSKSKQKTIESLLEEKEFLLNEVHHRMKNNMNSISGLISLKLSSITNEETKEIFHETISRIHSMELLYTKLYATKSFTEICLSDYIQDLSSHILNIFPQRKIQLVLEIENININTRIIFQIGIILNEVLTNILKYAFKDEMGNLIKIQALSQDKLITLKIMDNGIGFPVALQTGNKKNFGLQLIDFLTLQIGGTHKFENQNGTHFTLKFSDSINKK
jgi:PAS domain S-box-containing protein